MKNAMVLAISVIFSSGIYAAYDEEPIPTLNFEGGDYTVYKGNSISHATSSRPCRSGKVFLQTGGIPLVKTTMTVQ